MKDTAAPCLLFVLTLLVAVDARRDAQAIEGPSDVIVYADSMPSHKLGGLGWENPFDENGTRVTVEGVAGLRVPKGAAGWTTANWAKYVFLTNYEEGGSIIGCFPPPAICRAPGIEDQRIGVFDTETKAFCELDLDPNTTRNAAVQMVAVAPSSDPTGRTTRIYFEGIASNPNIYDPAQLPFSFGYLEADLARNPCVPYDSNSSTAGWRVVGFTGKNLNDQAGVLKPCDNSCPFGCRNWCHWDGMGLLDRNTLILGNYQLGRIVTVRVDDGGVLSIPAVYQMPLWQPQGLGGPCYDMRPVKNPGVDSTRGPGDFRFTWGFDNFCICAPGCSGCACGASAPSSPMQEFRFDGTQVSPTSGIFQTIPNGVMRSVNLYDSSGSLWVSENSDSDAAGGPGNVGAQLVVYRKHQTGPLAGEHAYYDPAPSSYGVIVPADSPLDVLSYEHAGSGVFHRVLSAVESDAVYFMGITDSVQRAWMSGGNWIVESVASYERHVGQTVLPSEHHNCIDTPPPDLAGVNFHLSAGGSPASLWTMLPFGDGERRQCDKHAFLVRIPLARGIDDAAASTRPGMAWEPTGGRMWLSRLQAGAVQFRVRDGGFWSSWTSLSNSGMPSGVSPADSGTLIANGATVELFTHGSNGQVYSRALSTPIDLRCAPAQCGWTSWSPLPALPPSTSGTANGVGAAFQGTQNPMVLVGAINGEIWGTARHSGVWRAWKQLTGMRTDDGPSAAWNPNDGYVWVAARNRTDGGKRAKFNRVNCPTPTTFNQIGWRDTQDTFPPGVTSWGTPPGIVFDGSRIRLFVASEQYPPGTYQAIEYSGVWSDWRRISTKSWAIAQPVAANVNGDVNLATVAFGGIAEQAME